MIICSISLSNSTIGASVLSRRGIKRDIYSMKVKKLKGGHRRIGGVVVDQEHLNDLRKVATVAVESDWTEDDVTQDITEREHIEQVGAVCLYPALPNDQVYCYIMIDDDLISIPELSFLLKLLQII